MPSATVRTAANFYGIALPQAAAPLMGVAELAISLALLAGFARRPVYGLAIVLHGTSTLATWRQLLDPFGLARPGNDLFIASVPDRASFDFASIKYYKAIPYASGTRKI